MNIKKEYTNGEVTIIWQPGQRHGEFEDAHHRQQGVVSRDCLPVGSADCDPDEGFVPR